MILSERLIKNEFNSNDWKQGKSLYEKKVVQIKEVKSGYIKEVEYPVYEVVAIVNEKNKQHTISLLACNGELLNYDCSCNKYSNYYYSYYNHECKHIVAACFEFLDYIKKNSIEVFTSKCARTMIASYTDQSIANTITNHLDYKVDIEPKIERYGKHCRISFRVGANKKYVIKNLNEFYQNLENVSKVSYGKDLELIHHINSFTEEGKQFVRFIKSRIEERQLLYDEDYSYYGKAPDKRYIMLTPHSIDVLFTLICNKEVIYTKISELKGKKIDSMIHCIQENPKLKLWVRPIKDTSQKGQREFQGVSIALEEIENFVGEQHLYVIKEDVLYQTDGLYKNKMEAFLDTMARYNNTEILIGKETLGAFYNQVLGRIKEYVEVIEEDIELEQHLPPAPMFHFYLDYMNENVSCKVIVHYGDQEYNIHKQEQDNGSRDVDKEFDVMIRIQSYCPYYDDKLMVNHCNHEEEMIYNLLENGIQEFLTLGEVHVSDSFKKLQIKPSPKVSVGVSIQSDLLNLELATENLNYDELADVLESYRLRKKYHRLKNGDFLRIEDNSLETLTELVDGLHLSVKELTKGKMNIPAYRALYLDKLLQESEGVSYERDQHYKKLIRNFKAINDCDYEVPGELKPILRNYQKVGYRWLRLIDEYGFGGILADDMGLGKTLQVITLMLSAKKEGKKGTSIVVCPASLVYNWDSELKQFAPELKVSVINGSIEERKEILTNLEDEDVLITSYDLLKRDIDLYEDKTFLYQIIDEAQYIKNQNAQASKAVKLIRAKTRFALTGTPIENRLSELWSIFDYLMPDYLYRYEQFKKTIETPIAKNKDEVALERLKKLVTPFILRRLKKDVLKDLPNKIEQITYTKLEGEQLELYTAYVAKVKQNLASQSAEDFQKNKLKILAELTRMRQICCDPTLCFEDYTGDSAKLNTCLELLEDAIDGGHKILLFSQFTSMLAIIAARLVEKKIAYYEITGETSKEKRLQLVNKFNEDTTPVFLISLKAGGTGLNLTGADIVIHYDPWWNVAAQNQATDRAHRIGQKNVVTEFKLIAKGTIEEKILKLQEAKSNLADQIMSGEGSQLSTMSKDDFMELL